MESSFLLVERDTGEHNLGEHGARRGLGHDCCLDGEQTKKNTRIIK